MPRASAAGCSCPKPRGLENNAESEASFVPALKAFGAAKLRAPGPLVHLARISDARLKIPFENTPISLLIQRAARNQILFLIKLYTRTL